jgi:hypothetical protein
MVEDDASEGLLTPDLGGEWERLEKRYRPSSRIFRPNTLQYCNLCIAQSRCFHLIIENQSKNPHSQYATIEKDARRSANNGNSSVPPASCRGLFSCSSNVMQGKECRLPHHSQILAVCLQLIERRRFPFISSHNLSHGLREPVALLGP